ncbi:hypothetical protein J1605_003430 [Eschrichtius robustus]|uniref:Small ribosomal subunit protein uS5 C-terminal domain-containing protein n=1 Tax=Eschrichtius robustus TaxID=9764 RepID=A0AB34HSA1_ESCRO|nr:hypothetical protein J1605_003430 [Eschrichtius robustus]
MTPVLRESPEAPGAPGVGGCGGFLGVFGSGNQGRGGGLGARGGKAEDKECLPITKLGRLVKDMKTRSLEEICLFLLPIKESEIIDFFLGASLKAEVTGRCGSVLVRLISAPRGTGIVSAPVPRKLLLMAGIDDCYIPPGAAPPPWATLPRPPLMPFPRPTGVSPLISGKGRYSPSLRIRNSLTIL